MKYGLLLTALLVAATAQYSSAQKTTTQTTTSAPTSTTHAPTSTTHAPTSTTHAPNTTTHAPNTTTHAPNTTTHAPNTTTLAPTTTPHPTLPTNLTVGKYNVSKDNKICILTEFAISIRVTTSKVNGTFFVQPSEIIPGGECGEKTATINLSFNNGGVVLKFLNNDTAQKVYVEYVSVDLTYAFKAGESVEYSGTNKTVELFAAASGHSYSCSSQTVYMGNGIYLDMTHNRIQAFNIKNDQFGTPDVCKADQPDYRVPIAVGIILIILIVIVVIAYLISRKRRTDGYQSL